MTHRDIRCGICGSPTQECFTQFISPKGDLWKVPAYVCTNEACLARQGATVQRHAKGRAPALDQYPPLHDPGKLE